MKQGVCGLAHLAEGSHEGRDLAVVGGVHIGSGLHQQLHHVKMAAVGSQPQRGIALLVTYVDVSSPKHNEDTYK